MRTCSVFSIFCCGFILGLNASEVYQNGIAAEVEGKIITNQEVNLSALALRGSYKESELQKVALDLLLEKEIVTAEFNRMKGQLPENYVEQRYNEVLNRNFNGDRMKFEQMLRSQGKTKHSYKEDIRDRSIVDFMYERNVAMPSSVSPKDILEYYNAHKSEMVQSAYFTLDQFAFGDNEKISEIVAKNLPYSETCDAIKTIPEVTVSVIEQATKDDIRPEIAEKITNAKTGEFFQVQVGNQSLWIGVREKHEAKALSVTEVSRKIEQYLISERYQELRKNWLNQLRSKAYCIVF